MVNLSLHAQSGDMTPEMYQQEKMQRMTDQQGREQKRMQWGRDTTKHDRVIPVGVKQWTLDPRLGHTITATNNDTIVTHYDHFNNTDGYNGEYSYLGNLASPRLSRIFFKRTEKLPFLMLQPLSFGIDNIADFRFTNTLSPLTNLSYHSCGSKQTGEERVRAYFASNINKQSGIGFKLDYLYGRGYYQNSQNSIFNGNLFGYYTADRYEMHAWMQAGHQKNAENGGIENDDYIFNPQSFPQSYGSSEIPTALSKSYNRNDYQTAYLTHRYNLGRYHETEWPDSLRPKMPTDKELLMTVNDSIKQLIANDTLRQKTLVDSLRNVWTAKLVKPQKYVSVASIIHTLQIDNLKHKHYDNDAPDNYYTNNFYGDPKSIRDLTKGLKVRNTLGLSMNEGFRPWVKMGITFFGTHLYERYTMPSLSADAVEGRESWVNNDILVGAQIDKRNGERFHYNVNGEIDAVGDNFGNFDIDGKMDFNIPFLKRDTIQMDVHAFIKNEYPNMMLRKFHSQTEWWDNDLNMQQRMRAEGRLTNKRSKTELSAGFENISNYTYLRTANTLLDEKNAGSTRPLDYSHSVRVEQTSKNIQIIHAQLKQDFAWKAIHWENEVTFQLSSEKDILPLPMFNAYTNLYLLFRIAKVLRVELGGDARYFTSYYAPDYAPDLGCYATQDTSNPRTKVGNYPIINVFANLHIKRCRIYVACNHVNQSHGNMFLAPHYPINPRTIHFGVSWNFYN